VHTIALGEGWGEGLIDCLQNALEIIENLVVPEPQHTNSSSLEESRPLLIPRSCGGFVVLSAIQFNRQPGFMAIKIDHIRLNGVLAAEFAAHETPVAQQRP
jgi:hypothetical protein